MTRKQKIKNILALFVNLCIVGGIYIYANMRMFLPIVWIYAAFTVAGSCLYIYLYMKDRIADANPPEDASEQRIEEMSQKRKKNMRTAVIIFLPFIIVMLCDCTYLLLLSDSEVFKAVGNIFR